MNMHIPQEGNPSTPGTVARNVPPHALDQNCAKATALQSTCEQRTTVSTFTPGKIPPGPSLLILHEKVPVALVISDRNAPSICSTIRALRMQVHVK
jgi:hypothetical protein